MDSVILDGIKKAIEPYIQERIQEARNETSIFVTLNDKVLTCLNSEMTIHKDEDEFEIFIETKEEII